METLGVHTVPPKGCDRCFQLLDLSTASETAAWFELLGNNTGKLLRGGLRSDGGLGPLRTRTNPEGISDCCHPRRGHDATDTQANTNNLRHTQQTQTTFDTRSKHKPPSTHANAMCLESTLPSGAWVDVEPSQSPAQREEKNRAFVQIKPKQLYKKKSARFLARIKHRRSQHIKEIITGNIRYCVWKTSA